MSLESLDNGWKRFHGGRIWRLHPQHKVLETDEAGHVPSYTTKYPYLLPKLARIRQFYSGKVNMGAVDRHGTGLDILVANAMAESYGSVPTPFSYRQLKNDFDQAAGQTAGVRLDEVLNRVKARSKWLVRKEPGYIDPLSTPHRVSVGAHHMLLSTARWLKGSKTQKGTAAYEHEVADLIFRFISSSPFAAQMAVHYFNRYTHRHQNEIPLMAATYNAGSPRASSRNPWHLVQYGDHIDRWVSFFNTSRQLVNKNATPAKPKPSNGRGIPPGLVAPTTTLKVAKASEQRLKLTHLKVVREVYTETTTIGRLYINEQFHCYTLEDRYRSDGKKVYGETAIAEGRYQVIVNMSNRFKRRMPLLLNVPQFAGIRIHKGNTAKDTLGCILVGKNKGPDRIWDCSGVYNSLLAVLEKATAEGKVWITIRRGR